MAKCIPFLPTSCSSMSAPIAKSKLFICLKSFYHNDSILFATGGDILEQLADNNGMHLATLVGYLFMIATVVTDSFESSISISVDQYSSRQFLYSNPILFVCNL
ncbi:hypothetical protein WN943_006850 [Citrus x changshan-huyou]